MPGVSLAESFWDLLGNWSGVEELSASPWSDTGTARAAMVFKLDLGGTAVVQDYRQVREDGVEARERQRADLSGGRGGSSPLTTELLAHGVLLADPADPAVVLWWLFDSYGQAPEPARGRWTGSTLELARPSPRGRVHHRFELGADVLTYAIDVAPDGQEVAPFLRGRYARVSGH